MRTLVLIATVTLFGVGCALLDGDPILRVLRLTYVGADEADNQFIWHVMPGDTIRVEATACELASRPGQRTEYRNCIPRATNFDANTSTSPIGNLAGVQTAQFVVGDTFTRQTGQRSGEFLVTASNGEETAAILFVNFLVRRLFVQADSLVLAVGDTIPIPLVGERTDEGIERRLAELPAVSVVAARGQSSPVEFARGGNRYPPISGVGYSRLPRGASDFIQSQLLFAVGRSVGRDTIEIRTRTRMLRLPVVVLP